jgi:cobalt-zinc-cadmium efflux system membrane fusion protein
MTPLKTFLSRGLPMLALAAVLAACGNDADKAGTAAAGGDKHSEGEKHDEHAEGAELTLSSEEAERAGVKVEAVKAASLGESITATATIEPDQDRLAQVAPRIAGRITSAPAKLGDRVRAGQVLATLDSVEVGESSAALQQAQAALRTAETELKRIEPLAADEIIPRKELLRAQAERDKAAAAVRAASDRLRVLGGSPGAGARASSFSVTAPFAGSVIEKKAVLGTLAGPDAGMFTIADLSRVWIQAALPEAALAKVAVGAPAKVTVSAYPGQTFEGLVGYIGAGLDKETRTASARIEVPNPDGRLKPQMFATATIEVSGEKREVISLPDAAIVLMDGQPSVFVYEQGAYAMRQIEPGERVGGKTVVKAGLKAGDEVVTAGAYALKARQQKSKLGHGH